MTANVRFAPSREEKLKVLGQAASYDLSCACGDSQPRTRGKDGLWIYPAALPSGQRVQMLKVLQQSGCERGCAYCAQRHGGINGETVAFAPEELARIFSDLYQKGDVFGLFLSSAISNGAVTTMDRLLATAEILRNKFAYRGYLHLKVLPGCNADQVERAMSLATRVSVNMEVPTAKHMKDIAPSKNFDKQILAPIRQIAEAEANGHFNRSGQTTQFVVGASNETDKEICSATSWLYQSLKLARVYYSGFQPVKGTPLSVRSAVPFMREHRLYQMDFLLRRYKFKFEELLFDEKGNLPLDIDPKTFWAKAHPEKFPMEINTAAPSELVRVPGIGPLGAKRLITMRKQSKIKSLDALKAAGVSYRIAAPYILLDGRAPRIAKQLELFAGIL